MAEGTHTLAMVGRNDLVDKTLDRLTRPDDVREAFRDRGRHFIQPGFFGLPGVGKSRLLAEIESRARQVTPYVVTIDFDGRSGPPPGTPQALVQRIIDELERADDAARSGWQRLLPRGKSPFAQCNETLRTAGVTVFQKQVIDTRDSTLADTSQGQAVQVFMDGTALPPQLAPHLAEAFAALRVKGKVTRQSGGGKPAPRPLIVVLLDTVEAASKALRAWLPTGLPDLWNGNGLHYHVVVVAAAREHMPGLIETELPPLSPADAAQFLREYVGERYRHGERYAPLDHLNAIREATPVQSRLIELGDGVPLLLGLLADVAARNPALLELDKGPAPATHAERFRYVLHIYLATLDERADAQQDASISEQAKVVKYGAVPRRIPAGSGLLRALFSDLPGTGFGPTTDYDKLRSRLKREAFVATQPDGSLVYHELMREGLLAAVAAEDRATWQDLHRRAADWFAAQGNELERLYHALQFEYDAALSALRSRIEGAIADAAWKEVQFLIDLTGDMELDPAALAWMTLYKAELAHGEGNGPLAERRIRRLLNTAGLPAELRECLADRLAVWYGMTAGAAAEGAEDALPKGVPLEQVLWWARQQRNRRLEAAALLGLGEAARMQARYGEAAGHYGEALAISRAIGARSGEANALRCLGEAARMQDRYGEALAISRAIGDRYGEANALRGLGEAALMQARYGEAAGHYGEALNLYGAIGMAGVGVNNALVAAGQCLDRAASHRAEGHASLATAAVSLARTLYSRCRDLLPTVDPAARAAYNLDQHVTARHRPRAAV